MVVLSRSWRGFVLLRLKLFRCDMRYDGLVQIMRLSVSTLLIELLKSYMTLFIQYPFILFLFIS